MNPKLKIYLDTSVPNFIFADDAPEKRDITKEFYRAVEKNIYEIYISELVLEEINDAPEPKKEQLADLIRRVAPALLEITEEAKELAGFYVERGIVPEKKMADAIHVAVAMIFDLDALVTWNYRHLANLRKSELFHGAGLEKRYFKKVELVTPMEVLSDEIR